MTLPEAIDVFVEGFCFTKSIASPYACTRNDELWVMQDVPGRRRAPRKVEVVTTGLRPGEVARRIAKQEIGWHFLCHIHGLEEDSAEIRGVYKSLGYRALSSEGFFLHDLNEIPHYESDPPVRLLATQEEAILVPSKSSQPVKVIPNSRLYMAWDASTDYGWVRSVPVGNAAWVSGLFVRPAFRGRGFGRSLMSALLQDDRRNGVTTSVLLASAAGGRLYPHVGYQQIGALQMFCPFKRL